MPTGPMAQSQTTERLLSDVAGGLRDRLGEMAEANRQQAVLIEQLRAEVAGLKRGLAQAKRQARGGTGAAAPVRRGEDGHPRGDGAPGRRVTVLRFLRRPDPDGDPIEWSELEDTDLMAAVWLDDSGTHCWSVAQGKRHLENGLSTTRRSARLESRRYAVHAMTHVLDWGRWS